MKAGAQSTQIRAQWLQGQSSEQGQPHRALQAGVSDRLVVYLDNRGKNDIVIYNQVCAFVININPVEMRN